MAWNHYLYSEVLRSVALELIAALCLSRGSKGLLPSRLLHAHLELKRRGKVRHAPRASSGLPASFAAVSCMPTCTTKAAELLDFPDFLSCGRSQQRGLGIAGPA